jgi:hypothetical protein
MQFGGPGVAEKSIPRIRSERCYTSESSVYVAELYRTDQPGEVAAERTHSLITFSFGIDRDDEKDRSACERSEHWLRKRELVWFVQHRDPVDLFFYGFALSQPKV